MQLQWQIIEEYPENDQIVVRFYSAEFPPEPVDTNVREDGLPTRCLYDRAITLRGDPLPTGAALDAVIEDAGQNVLADMCKRLGVEMPEKVPEGVLVL